MPYNEPHIIKEEDLENNPQGNSGAVNAGISGGSGSGGQAREEEDVYNSVPAVKKKLSGRDFFGFFKLPLIIIVFIIEFTLFFCSAFGFCGIIENGRRKLFFIAYHGIVFYSFLYCSRGFSGEHIF